MIEPVTGVLRVFASLFGNGVIVLSSGLEERVSAAWVRVGDAVVIKEGFEARLSPAKGAVS